MTAESKGFMDKLWDMFSSMKMGIFLLGLVAIGAAVGSLFPQEALEPDKAKLVGQLWKSLGFTHVYSSIWFQLLLGLLCINLIVCSIQRFYGIYNQTFKIILPNNTKEVPQKIRKSLSGNSEDLKLKTTSILHQAGYRVNIEEGLNGWSFIANKRKMGLWGSLITHIAFVVLVIGALVGSLFGFQGYFMAGPGSEIPIQKIGITKGSVSQDFSVRINATENKKLPTGEQENWYSDLSIIEKGKEVVQKTISANHPLTYKGITFYQSSYLNGVKLTANTNGIDTTVVLPEGARDYYQVPGTDLIFVVVKINNPTKNPTILFNVYKHGNQGSPELAQYGTLSKGQTANIKDQFTIRLDDYSMYTGIKVKGDPGVNLVWLGSGLLLLGLFLSFYWRPMFISGIYEQEPNKTGKLTIGSRSGKLVRSAQEELDKIEAKLAKSDS